MSRIFEFEAKALFNKIMEKRLNYLTQFGVDPDYVVIPIHYNMLIEQNSCYCVGNTYDTFTVCK